MWLRPADITAQELSTNVALASAGSKLCQTLRNYLWDRVCLESTESSKRPRPRRSISPLAIRSDIRRKRDNELFRKVIASQARWAALLARDRLCSKNGWIVVDTQRDGVSKFGNMTMTEVLVDPFVGPIDAGNNRTATVRLPTLEKTNITWNSMRQVVAATKYGAWRQTPNSLSNLMQGRLLFKKPRPSRWSRK